MSIRAATQLADQVSSALSTASVLAGQRRTGELEREIRRTSAC
jgi:hypothetical protein